MEDKDIDKLIQEVLEKDVIDQKSSIDEEMVEKSLGEMEFLWDTVIKKLKEDGVCFSCKRQVDFSGEKVHVLQATKTDKGVCAFIAVCEHCKNSKEEKKTE